ncbi:MAG: peptidase S41 [Polaromonas sp.]|nr:peptidase S41 [Polaromonas sp.]
MKIIQTVGSVLFVTWLSACGGSGVPSGNTANTAALAPPSTAGAYVEPTPQTAANVARQCVAPRPANVLNPQTRQPYGDAQGSLTTEKLWVRAFINDTYLWYDEIVAQDPALFVVGASAPFVEPSDNSSRTINLSTSILAVNTYFNSQRSTAATLSGRPKDRFHFTIPTADYTTQSSGGVRVGFGFQVALLASTPPRKAVVAYSDPGSLAAQNNLGRGAEFISVNGVSVVSGSAASLNEGLFSPVIGQQYSFEVRDVGSAVTRMIVMAAAPVTSVPVQNVRTLPAPYGGVGYLLFNDHIATAEGQLVAAVNQLKAANNGAGVSDLVLDMRYNGGGLLAIASELAYMVAGSATTSGKVFEKLSFNNKNPFGLTDAATATPFHNTTLGFSVPAGQALPQLGLARVFVLTGAGTCSASESVMNGLAGAGVRVIQVGATTCGKPYGFLPQDNCGTTYFAIQFKGVNQLGYGDYSDGFVPGGSGNQFAGCLVADDFTKSLGDVTEARLATALQFRQTGTCSAAAPTSGVRSTTAALVRESEPELGRGFYRENRIYDPARFN